MNNFSYQRKIRFADTDSAGIVYFSNLLSICHEAYEEFLSTLDINLVDFFSSNSIAIPIIHAQIDFFEPLYCGDVINIELKAHSISEKVFTLEYQIFKNSLKIATASTKHITINPETKKTEPIPEILKKNLVSHN